MDISKTETKLQKDINKQNADFKADQAAKNAEALKE